MHFFNITNMTVGTHLNFCALIYELEPTCQFQKTKTFKHQNTLKAVRFPPAYVVVSILTAVKCHQIKVQIIYLLDSITELLLLRTLKHSF